MYKAKLPRSQLGSLTLTNSWGMLAAEQKMATALAL